MFTGNVLAGDKSAELAATSWATKTVPLINKIVAIDINKVDFFIVLLLIFLFI
jgi:hypothetical protein